MNVSLKKLCIYSLATGLGLMIKERLNADAPEFSDLDAIERRVILDNAEELILTGQDAIDNCQVKVDSSSVRRCHRKIEEICKDGQEYDVVEVLSFLFLGLADLELFCGDKKRIAAVKDAALNFMVWDEPGLDDEAIQFAAMVKYCKWIAD
jgi:hypothetical protein